MKAEKEKWTGMTLFTANEAEEIRTVFDISELFADVSAYLRKEILFSQLFDHPMKRISLVEVLKAFESDYLTLTRN